MKKAIGIIILGLMWCNTSLAQVVTLNCELVEWNRWWGTDEKPSDGKLPKQAITIIADLDSKVVRWGTFETSLIVSDNAIEFYRYIKNPYDNKEEVEFRYIIDRTNMQFQMIMMMNDKKEGASAIGKCRMVEEKQF